MVTPRPCRISKCCRSSTSSNRTWRLNAGWATLSKIDARVKLPNSATHTKYSNCFKSMRYLILLYQLDELYRFFLGLTALQLIYANLDSNLVYACRYVAWPIFPRLRPAGRYCDP